MRFVDTEIPGVTLIQPDKFSDDRGFFCRAFCADEFAQHGLINTFAQCNLSETKRQGTVRGIHYQIGSDAEAKFIRCMRGAIFDVAVDIDPESPSYLKYVGIELTADNAWGLYLPPTCAHAFQSLADNSVAYYQVSNKYAPQSEAGLRFDDPALNISWPVPVSDLSEKDRNWPLLEA